MSFRTAYVIAVLTLAAGAVHAADRAPAPSTAPTGSNPSVMVDGATRSAGSADTAADDSRATTNRTRTDDHYYATDPEDEAEVGGNRTGAVDNDLDTERDSDNERDRDLNRTGAADNDHSTQRTYGSGDTARD